MRNSRQKKDVPDNKKEKTFSLHPLSVLVTIEDKSMYICLVLYLVLMNQMLFSLFTYYR